jgi:hypothetical protein
MGHCQEESLSGRMRNVVLSGRDISHQEMGRLGRYGGRDPSPLMLCVFVQKIYALGARGNGHVG